MAEMHHIQCHSGASGCHLSSLDVIQVYLDVIYANLHLTWRSDAFPGLAAFHRAKPTRSVYPKSDG